MAMVAMAKLYMNVYNCGGGGGGLAWTGFIVERNALDVKNLDTQGR